MKRSIMIAITAIATTSTQPCWAGNDSTQASDAIALSALACAITPAVVGVVAYAGLRDTGRAIVKVVDNAGNAIGDLTEDIFNDVTAAASTNTNVPTANACKKEIPLIINNHYVEMNEKVTP